MAPLIVILAITFIGLGYVCYRIGVRDGKSEGTMTTMSLLFQHNYLSKADLRRIINGGLENNSKTPIDTL